MIIRKNTIKQPVIYLNIKIIFSVLGLSFLTPVVYAAQGAQLTIVPSSTSAIALSAGGSSTISYTVTANAPVENIQISPSSAGYFLPAYITASASGSCIGASLAPHASCQFNLSLSTAAGNVGKTFTLAPRVSGNGGASNSIPSEANRIPISITNTPSVSYTVTAGGSDVSISPNTAQTVKSGATQTFVVTANNGYTVSQVVGGSCAAGSWSGSTYTTGAITSSCVVVFSATVDSAPITANVSTALFSFNAESSTGTMGTGSSVITITNTGTSPALNVANTSLPSGITESSNNCGSSLAGNSSCQITFSTTATPDSSQTITIEGTNTSTITLPIAPVSVRVYSPPVNPIPSTASLMVVKTCATPEQLLLTNNSNADVSGIGVEKDSGLSNVDLTTAMTNCPTTLPAGKSCVIGITAPSSSASTNIQGNILIHWGSSQQNGAVLTGVETSNASTLPSVGTPSIPMTLSNGDYVYSVDPGCNLVKAAAQTDQYTGSGTVAWTTSNFTGATVPNPATGTGTGAQNIGDAAGQINTTAIIYQAGTSLLTTYAAGLCSQYSEASGGVNYVGWYLPWDNGDSSGSTTTELALMYTNLKLGQGSNVNGFANQFYWSSSEFNGTNARDRYFNDGNPSTNDKTNSGDYVRCSRALTY